MRQCLCHAYVYAQLILIKASGFQFEKNAWDHSKVVETKRTWRSDRTQSNYTYIFGYI